MVHQEKCLYQAQRNERESIRQKLALGSFYDDGPAFFTGCSKGSKNCLSSRLQNEVNLQMCFVNDSSSDKDSDAEDSRTETSLDTPLSPMSKQSSSLSDRDTGEELELEPEDAEFWRLQRRLQEEARGALALARPMARMQVEVERQIQLHRRSPVADLLPHLPHISESLMKRSLRPMDLRDMSLGQLQVITNDLHSQIQGLNEELVQLLLMRDELHVEQDAMLVDVEDLTRHAHSQQRQMVEKALAKRKGSLLLLLSSSLCQLSDSGPVGAQASSLYINGDTCKRLARVLLRNVTSTLAMDHLFRGLDCTEQTAELHLRTKTLTVCAPPHTQCSDGGDVTFDQDECFQSVVEDLRQYRATFKSYSDRDNIIEQSVIRSIENLMQMCFSDAKLDGSQPLVSMGHENSF